MTELEEPVLGGEIVHETPEVPTQLTQEFALFELGGLGIRTAQVPEV